jgi:hypothetical protein
LLHDEKATRILFTKSASPKKLNIYNQKSKKNQDLGGRAEQAEQEPTLGFPQVCPDVPVSGLPPIETALHTVKTASWVLPFCKTINSGFTQFFFILITTPIY